MQEKTNFSLYYDPLPIPVSVVDLSGRLLYYNPAAAAIFDRKPEYIGQDIRRCHKKAMSVAKIEGLLTYIKDKGKPPATYEIERDGKKYRIVISRLELEGKLHGFIQSVLSLSAADTL